MALEQGKGYSGTCVWILFESKTIFEKKKPLRRIPIGKYTCKQISNTKTRLWTARITYGLKWMQYKVFQQSCVTHVFYFFSGEIQFVSVLYGFTKIQKWKKSLHFRILTVYKTYNKCVGKSHLRGTCRVIVVTYVIHNACYNVVLVTNRRVCESRILWVAGIRRKTIIVWKCVRYELHDGKLYKTMG